MSTGQLQFVDGDATRPIGGGPRIIAHVCNDRGGWGAGFVLAISKRWTAPEREYRIWFPKELGSVQLVKVEANLWVANMVAQHGYQQRGGRPPIRYDALENCLSVVGTNATTLGASVHMPRIGCGLAGGRWSTVEKLVRSTLVEHGVAVTIYDYNC